MSLSAATMGYDKRTKKQKKAVLSKEAFQELYSGQL
jgi:hypothetical protein